MRFPVFHLLVFNLSVILSISSFAAHAKMYKWVDDEGQMHFGDKIPLEYKKKAHDELNEMGVTARHSEAAKTPEQIAKEKRLVEDTQKASREVEKQKKLDRVLLDAYDSERDLIKARDSRLDDVALQIQLAESIITTSNKKIVSLEKQVSDIKASNRQVPGNLFNSLDNEKKYIVMQNKIIDKNRKRSEDIKKKYNGYIERFRAAKLR